MKSIIALLIISVGFTSCYHVYYAPNTPNAPLLSKKGETRINGLYAAGADSEYEGAELQVAHAVNSNVGIMVNGFTASKSEEVSNYSSSTYETEKGSGSYIEFAGGLYKAFDPKAKWIGEIYGGVGFGSVKNEYGYIDHSKVGITKFFIQPSIGYKSPYFEFAVVPKVSIVNWKVKQENISSPDNQDHKDEVSMIRQDPGFIAFEPAFILRGGAKGFKLQLGLSFSNYKPSNLYATNMLAETLNGSIGVSIDLMSNHK